MLRKLSLLLPRGPLTWWGIVPILYGGAYLLARSQFERVEVPGKPQEGSEWM